MYLPCTSKNVYSANANNEKYFSISLALSVLANYF